MLKKKKKKIEFENNKLYFRLISYTLYNFYRLHNSKKLVGERSRSKASLYNQI